MTTYDTSPERQGFEAWMQERFPSAPLYRRDAKGSLRFGQYCSSAVEDQWETWKARGAIIPSASIADIAGAKPDLHGQIMNNRCYVPDGYGINMRVAYQQGRRDARHASADLVNAATPASSVADAAGASEVRLSYKTLERMYGDANLLISNRWCEKYRIIKQVAKESGND
jgi:hypothetical protein